MYKAKLMPRAKAYCDECFHRVTDRGLNCPFLKWDKRVCEQIKKVSDIEKVLQKEIDNAPETGRRDFSVLYECYGKAVFELSLENCFRNGKLPQNMPEVL